MKLILKILVVFLLSFHLYAQDIHWSQYDHNPVFQNPANVGMFDGDYRFHANIRDQWRSVTVPFKTQFISAEAKQILFDKISIGGFFFNDVAGDGAFRTIEFQPSLAYTQKLTSDSTHVLRGGLQFGLNTRSFNANAFNFDNQWNGTFFNPNLSTNESIQTQRRTNFTWGTGITYQFLQSDRKNVTAGIALFNINRPNQGFYGDQVKRDLRTTLFARATYDIGFDWDVLPSFQLNIQGKYRELILGGQARYILIDRLGEYRSIMFGGFLRSRDAGYFMAGMEYQNWWAGISYDINFSSLYLASRARGGFEISLRYILKTFKPNNIQHRVCPDYI